MEAIQTLPEIAKGFNIRLTSKKVQTGKCQVKFTASTPTRKDLYGYVWVDAKTTLKEGVGQIGDRLASMAQPTTGLSHIGMYPIGRNTSREANMVIFDA